VPQGGILAPILFSLFFNGVGKSLGTNFYGLFADDLSFSYFSKKIEDLLAALNSMLNRLNDWCLDKDLIINFSETKFMIFSKRSLSKDLVIPSLMCRGNEVELVNEFKYLGIIFDSLLNFNSHFNSVVSRVSSAIGCLLYIKRYLSLHTFKILLSSFVLSIIDYGFTIWGSICGSKINILQSKINFILGSFFHPQIVNKFQRLNRISHSVASLKFHSVSLNYFDMYEKCNILTVSERLKYFYAIFVFKSLQFSHVPELSEIFKGCQSSRSQNLILPSHQTKSYENSPVYQSMTLWNELPSAVKDFSLSLPKFVSFINSWLLEKRMSDFVSN